MEIARSKLEGLLLITPPRCFSDARGFFVEAYRQEVWDAAGLPHFVQDNHSRSGAGVLRGLHLNSSGGGQGKLVRCAAGRIFDVAVDLRRDSPTLGLWEGYYLDDQAHCQVYVPPGFAHGFCVLSEVADVCYKLSTYYDERCEQGVIWNDARIGVEWPVREPLLSVRDRSNGTLDDFLASASASG